MIRLIDKQNVGAATATWPYGQVLDDTGSDDGTRLNENNMSDLWQIWEKIFDESGLTANGLLDNDSNGWQLYAALLIAAKPYDVYTGFLTQSGTNDPTVVVLTNELSGAIVFTYSAVGLYTGTLVGAFPAGLTWAIANGDGGDTMDIQRVSDDTITVANRDDTGAFSNTFSDRPIEIRVYRS